MNKPAPSYPDTAHGAVHKPLPHDSAHKHVCGEAVYTDDIPEPRNMLHVYVRLSERAHARLTKLDVDAVRAAPGVSAVMTARDLPFGNDIGPVFPGDRVFAGEEVEYFGQALFAVAGESIDGARAAAMRAEIEYEDLPAVLSIEQALEHQAYVLPSRTFRRGDSAKALAEAPRRLRGRFKVGGQDHFYLEGQVALAIPQEDGDMLVYSSTQHPTEVQHLVAKVIGRADHAVTVEVRRLGGGFGGKETQAAQIACIAALLANRTDRPVKLRLDRDDDMLLTGKRHDFLIDYDVGFDESGRIRGAEIMLAGRCGVSPDLSGAVNDRAMFHADNAYYLENATIVSHRCRTHTVSNTAFRGFGGPQGMMGIEYVMDEIARDLGMDPLAVRKRNLYGVGERNVTPYFMTVEDNILPRLVAELEQSADYAGRRRAVRAYNATSPYLKKGLALTPVKFGISFTTKFMNQAGALVHVYTDGSVQLNHGGIEMGQGLHVKVAQVVAHEFGIDIGRVRITATTTDKVPNTSPTAASSGADMNAAAARNAALRIKRRMMACVREHFDVAERKLVFRDGRVWAGGEALISFPELAKLAHLSRQSLSATGFYRTPKLDFDDKTGRGRPFYYFAYGAAVSEVLVDTLTGEYKVTRVDILHDCGRSLNPAVDLGQIEGGFIQGMGWLTTEELWWDERGRLMTHAPSTYKIPACGDLPADFRVRILEPAKNRENAIHRSKATGEPPLMLAMSVFHALKDAVAAVGDYRVSAHLDTPATPERVLMAMEAVRTALDREAEPVGVLT